MAWLGEKKEWKRDERKIGRDNKRKNARGNKRKNGRDIIERMKGYIREIIEERMEKKHKIKNINK